MYRIGEEDHKNKVSLFFSTVIRTLNAIIVIAKYILITKYKYDIVDINLEHLAKMFARFLH
jgi:hypothetical protein